MVKLPQSDVKDAHEDNFAIVFAAMGVSHPSIIFPSFSYRKNYLFLFFISSGKVLEVSESPQAWSR